MSRHVSRGGGGRSRTLALVLVPRSRGPRGGGHAGGRRARPRPRTRHPEGPEPLRVLVAELSPSLAGPDHDEGRRGGRAGPVASAQVAVGQIGAGRVPDVWVPDSSTWLDSLTGTGDSLLLPVAGRPGRPSPQPGRARLAEQGDNAMKTPRKPGPTSSTSPPAADGQPHTDTASRLAYHARGSTARRTSTPHARRGATSRPVSRPPLLSSSSTCSPPGTPEPHAASSLVLPEHATAAFAAESPGLVRPLVPTAGTASLDYPGLVNLVLELSCASTAAKALAVLQGSEGRAAIAKAGVPAGATPRRARRSQAPLPRMSPSCRSSTPVIWIGAVGHPAHKHPHRRDSSTPQAR